MNLTNQYISESFHSLLQISGSGVVTDGTGSIVKILDVTASYISPEFINSVVATSNGLAVTTGTNVFTGSQIFSGSLIPASPYVNNTSLFNIGSPSASWKDLFIENIYLVSGSKSSSINLSGSNFIFNGGIAIPNNNAFYGYLQGTASYALNAKNAIIDTGSFATTGSNIFKGDITVQGNLTAQQIIISSSVYYVTESFSSGSTRFGNDLGDVHEFTGSVNVYGGITGSLSGTASFATTASYILNAVSASFSTSSSRAVSSSFATSSSLAQTASYVLNAESASYAISASYILNAVSASFATTASYAVTASQSVTASYVLNAVSASFSTTSSYILNAVSASQASTASYVLNAISASYIKTAESASFAITSSYILNAVSASFAVSASYAVTASYIKNAESASFATSSSLAQTASYVLNAISASFATTSSYVLNAISASQASTASYVLNAVTASYVKNSESASFAITASYILNAVSSSQAVTAAYAITSSYVLNAVSASQSVTASYVLNAISASYVKNSESASYILNAVSSSYALSASYATTASYVLNSISASQATTASYILNAISASFATTASYVKNAESASYATTASYISPTFISESAAAAGFGSGTVTGNAFPYTGSAIITGSLTVTGSVSITQLLTVSQSISASNINVGIPTSNAWQTNLGGSYFNNFNSNTNVSEILRFIAGLLSGSAPDASPNTRTFSSISRTSSSFGTGTITGAVPISSSVSDITYLISKGFAQTGSAIFNNLTVYTSSAYSITYSSVAAGSTAVSSSADAQLFGLGNIIDQNTPNTFYVSGTINFRFDESSSQTSTATSQSQQLLTNNTFGTTNGLTIGKIPTVNAAVIPSAYQDGKFASILGSSAVLYNGGRSYTSVSSSGYYHISASIKIASGSSAYSTEVTSNDKIFWAPINSISIPTQVISASLITTASLTLTSGSLSGAPYVRTGTWNQLIQISGAFYPLYRTNANVASMSISGAGVTLTAAASSNTLLNIVTAGTINTANVVYDSSGVTLRSTSTVPFETDIIKLSGSISFNAGSNGLTNITASTITPTTFNVNTIALNRTGSTGLANTQSFAYHVAGTFGQPVSSGSLAYFGFPTVSSLTATTESFTDEANRIQLTDAILNFTGLAFDSGSRLNTKDLQVKPGYLVDPSGSRRYWYPSGYGDTFKYYVRKFKRTNNIASFTLNVGQTLVAWDDTTTANGVSVGIIFESAVSGSNGLSVTRIFDPYYSTGLKTSNISANTSGTNPFNSAIDYYGIRLGSVSSTTYTVEINSSVQVKMDGSTYDEFYLILRYKGETTNPVTTILIS